MKRFPSARCGNIARLGTPDRAMDQQHGGAPVGDACDTFSQQQIGLENRFHVEVRARYPRFQASIIPSRTVRQTFSTRESDWTRRSKATMA